MKSSNKSVYKEVYSYVMDLRQTIFDLPIQSIITRDNVEIRVHPMMLIQITDPVRVAYEVEFSPFSIITRLMILLKLLSV